MLSGACCDMTAVDADDDVLILLVQQVEALHIMRLDAKNTLAALNAACTKKIWFHVVLILHHKRLNLAPSTIDAIRDAAFEDNRPDVAMAIPNGVFDARWNNGILIVSFSISPLTHACGVLCVCRGSANGCNGWKCAAHGRGRASRGQSSQNSHTRASAERAEGHRPDGIDVPVVLLGVLTSAGIYNDTAVYTGTAMSSVFTTARTMHLGVYVHAAEIINMFAKVSPSSRDGL